MKSPGSRSLTAKLMSFAAVSLLLVFLQPVTSAQAASTTTRDLLDDLQVATEVRTGYDRDLFSHWTDADGNGCNTRAEVLIAESLDPVTRTGTCTITGGTWYSPYDDATWTVPSDVDIDHMVPLAEAWDSGARSWSAATREAFANDLTIPESLIAVTDNVNQSKSDRDPAEWMPSNATYACDYATAWIRVKYRWSLTVDADEHATLSSALDGSCGDRVSTAPPLGAAAAASYTFTDVPSSYIWHTEVTWLAGEDVTTGYLEPNGTRTFRPGAPILREQMAAFLYRLAKANATSTSCGLLDVPSSHTFAKEICWLKSTGITTGYAVPGGTEFRGSQPVLREQMAAFLRRYSNPASTPNPASSPFTDVAHSHVFYRDIAWLAANGISTGWPTAYGCREYRPSTAIQRGDMAAFLYRMSTGNTAPPIYDGSGCQPPPPPPPPPPPGGPVPPIAGTFNCPSYAPIKGNQSSMIYHVPGGQYYDRTNPEQCFRTEADAVNAGYRRSQR